MADQARVTCLLEFDDIACDFVLSFWISEGILGEESGGCCCFEGEVE